MESFYGVMTVLGPLLLGLALLWAVLQNRKRSSADKNLSERATKKLYAEPDRPDSGMKH